MLTQRQCYFHFSKKDKERFPCTKIKHLVLQKSSFRSVRIHNENNIVEDKIIKEAENGNHIQLLFAFEY